MKASHTLHTALAALILSAAACLSPSPGAPVLTPVGPSLAEMTASAAPPTPTALRTPTVQTQVTASATLPPTPTQWLPPQESADETVDTAPVEASLALTPTPCGIAWFTSRADPGSCPQSDPDRLEAAYQTFEHGAMVWRKTHGFIILPFNPATNVQAGIVSFYPDEVTIYRDTSAEVSPPPGLLGPVSGFGLVWRGDIFEEPGSGFQATLGWATAPETGYTLTEQSGTQAVYHGGPNVSLTTYLTLPDGRLLRLARLATPNQPTTLTFLTPSP